MPGKLGPVYRAWMAFGHAISKVTSPVVMGAAYFLVLTPIGLLMRACGYNAIRHREKDGGFWVSAPSGGRSNLETQF